MNGVRNVKYCLSDLLYFRAKNVPAQIGKASVEKKCWPRKLVNAQVSSGANSPQIFSATVVLDLSLDAMNYS